MITITKQDNGVLFEFEDSKKYLYGNGSILVPFNTLSIIADESNMITLRKAASNDIFLSARYDTDLGYGSKDDAIDDLKDLLFAETGGGSGSGMTPSEVQEMIDESISGMSEDIQSLEQTKADTSALTAVANDVQTVSGQVATKVAISDFNAYSAATDARLAEDEEVTAAALNNLAETVSGKQDTLVYYSESTEDGTAGILITNGEGSTEEHHFSIGGGVAEIGIYNKYDDGQGNVTANNSYVYADQIMVTLQAGVTENGDTTSTELMVETTGVTINGDAVATEPYVDAALSGKVDTSAITTSITSGSTDSEIPTAKAVYDAIPTGGGATYSAGTNISIANDVISVNLPIEKKHFWNGDGIAIIGNANSFSDAAYSVGIGFSNTISASRAFILGSYSQAKAQYSVALNANNIANAQFSLAANQNTTTNNVAEAAFGAYNNSVTGATASGQTLFSVGNGTADNARHNAFEIRQNGDIYVNDGTNDVRLQDTILALGGLKFVQCTQAEYDALVSGGTVDSSTIYFITNVVS